MNELREELRAVADRVPATTVAEGAWDTARGRVRRRRAAAVGAAAAAVVVAAVGVRVLTGGPSEVEPAPLPPTADSLVEVASEPVADEWLDPLLGEALDRARDGAVVPLAEDPLDGPAIYAVGVGRSGVQVLGADGRYRSMSGLEVLVNGGQPLRSGSLSPDGTQLALPQPGRVLVVDLLDGSSARVAAGGISTTDVAWVDDDTIAVWANRQLRTVDVGRDLTEDEVRASVSEVVGTGLPVSGLPGAEWYPEVPGLVLDGEEVPVPSVRQEPSSLVGPVAVAGDGWVAVAAAPAEESDLPRGIAIIDTETGQPRAFLPMEAIVSPEELRDDEGGIGTPYYGPPSVAPLAADGDTAVVVSMQTTYGVLVLRWDWVSDDLSGIVAEDTGGLPDGTAISWGVGFDG